VADELPDRPVQLWADERDSLWTILLTLPFFPFISTGNRRGIAKISVNGLSLESVRQTAGRGAPGGPASPKRVDVPFFTSWSEIDRIEPAPAPALARVVLNTGTVVELGPEHLPSSVDETERQRRLKVLQHALTLGRQAEVPFGDTSVSRRSG